MSVKTTRLSFRGCFPACASMNPGVCGWSAPCAETLPPEIGTTRIPSKLAGTQCERRWGRTQSQQGSDTRIACSQKHWIVTWSGSHGPSQKRGWGLYPFPSSRGNQENRLEGKKSGGRLVTSFRPCNTDATTWSIGNDILCIHRSMAFEDWPLRQSLITPPAAHPEAFPPDPVRFQGLFPPDQSGVLEKL